MSWVHDNEIKSYSVDLEIKQVIFITKYENKNIFENTKIIFENVIASEFKNVGSDCQNIIFDIKAYDINEFLNDYSDLIKERKNWGWPLYYKDESELKKALEDKNQKYYYLDDVCGMFGFILAGKCTIEVNGEIKEEL